MARTSEVSVKRTDVVQDAWHLKISCQTDARGTVGPDGVSVACKRSVQDI